MENNPSQKANKDIVFGTRAIIETIEAGNEIDKILLQKDQGSSETHKALLQLARQYQIPISKVPIFKLNKITRKNHQGAIAFISAIQYASLDHIISEAFTKGEAPIVLILDRITDVRNFGAITRTAECMGVHAVVVPLKNAAQANRDAMKTSAGALNYLPVCREASLFKAVKFLKESGLQVVACTEQAEASLFTTTYASPTAIIMGSEEDGISKELLRQADALVKIPMQGKIASLNVSVATGMILSEVMRQRSVEA
ncbi:MAG: 23S rRNA (guanosine(2251)-2'-O)-methyltransferase RlmB [Thermonemataceae bacterium]